MYRYQTKHKILSLLLVFSLLILTTVLVFPSPALAQDWDLVWWQDSGIVLPPVAPYFTPPVGPGQLDKLILDVPVPPGDFGDVIVDLYLFGGSTYGFVLSYNPWGWSSVDPGVTVTDNPPGHIEAIFDPPQPVDQIWFFSIFMEPVSIELIQFVASLPNQAPVADADGPYSGSVGSSITFDGSASYDPDEPYGDQIISWEWDLNGDGQYDDASGEIVQESWGSPYSGSIGLNVTDTLGAWDTDETRVNVTPAPTPPPVTEVGGEVYPINKVSLLAPWIALSAAIIAGAAVVVRRRRAQS